MTTPPHDARRYWCFLSYRHADNRDAGREWATWLHHLIETYEVPTELVGRKNRYGDIIPERVYPVFRDEEELSAASELAAPIHAALLASRTLLVLCSPRAVHSEYVAGEVRTFQEAHGTERVFAVLLDGEPYASRPGTSFDPDLECLPEPLRNAKNASGQTIEVLAADLRRRDGSQSWTTPGAHREALAALHHDDAEIDAQVAAQCERHELARLKILAGILGVDLAELTQREKAYRLAVAERKARALRRWLTAVGALFVLAVIGGAAAWILRGIAQEQTQLAITRDHDTRVRYADTLLTQGRAAEARQILLGVVRGQEQWEWRYLMARCGMPPQLLDETVRQQATLTDADLVLGDEAYTVAQFLARAEGPARRAVLGNDEDPVYRLVHPAQLLRQRAGEAAHVHVTESVSTKNFRRGVSCWSPTANALLGAIQQDGHLGLKSAWISRDGSVLLVSMVGEKRDGVFSSVSLAGDSWGGPGLWAFALADRRGEPGKSDGLKVPDNHNDDRTAAEYARADIETMQRRGQSGASDRGNLSGATWQRGLTRIRFHGRDCRIYVASQFSSEHVATGGRKDGPELVLCSADGTKVLRRTSAPNSIDVTMPNRYVRLAAHDSEPWVLIETTNFATGTFVAVVDLDTGAVLYETATSIDRSNVGFAWQAGSRRIAIIDKDKQLTIRDGFEGEVLTRGELTEFAGGFAMHMDTSPKGDRMVIGRTVLDTSTLRPVLTLPAEARISPDWRSITLSGAKRCREVIRFGYLEDAAQPASMTVQQRLTRRWLAAQARPDA